jgi:hypothetical protein
MGIDSCTAVDNYLVEDSYTTYNYEEFDNRNAQNDFLFT